MPGFRTNVSLEQQMPGSSDSGDDDLNYNITNPVGYTMEVIFERA